MALHRGLRMQRSVVRYRRQVDLRHYLVKKLFPDIASKCYDETFVSELRLITQELLSEFRTRARFPAFPREKP